MTRRIVVIGVPSNIGIKPYDDGRPRGVDRAPTTLREQGVVERLSARDDGDVLPAPYRDFTRPHGRPRNDEELLDLTRRLSSRVARAVGAGEFPLVLGGDCSVVLGALAGLRRAGISRPGLVYLDAHADFATPEESKSGSVASMCLGLAVGRGQTILSALADTPALVLDRHVALVGGGMTPSPGTGSARSGHLQCWTCPMPRYRRAGTWRPRGAFSRGWANRRSMASGFTWTLMC